MTHNEIFFFLFWLKKEKKKWPLLRVDAVLCKCIIPWLSLSHTVFSRLKGNFSSIPDCIGAPSETSWMSRKLDPKLLCRARQSSDRKPAMKRDRQRRRQLHHNHLQAGQTAPDEPRSSANTLPLMAGLDWTTAKTGGEGKTSASGLGFKGSMAIIWN